MPLLVRTRAPRARRALRVIRHAASVAVASLALAGAVALPASAQVVERPASFDVRGRVQSLTPALVSRFGLSAPTWPVTGDFRQARLFSREGGGSVLTVERPDGSVERMLLDDAAVAALRAAVDRGSGNAAGTPAPLARESRELVSEPAGNAFVRRQTLLGLAMYGPAAAVLVSGHGDAAGPTAAYALVAGGTFFAAASAVRSHPITRAQNIMSTDASLRGAGMAAMLLDAARVRDGKAYAAGVLAGGIGGTFAALAGARGLTDAEAAASAGGASVAMLLSAGIGGAGGAFGHGRESATRATEIGAVAAGLAGYALGPRYARQTTYNVTAGDLGVLTQVAALGALGFAAPAIERKDNSLAFGLATAGFATGLIAGDRFFVRRYDHTDADARLVGLGSSAGALVGLGVAALLKTSAGGALGLVSAGGLTGLLVTEGMAAPPFDGSARTARPGASERGGLGLELSPVGAAFAVARRRGTFPLLKLRF